MQYFWMLGLDLEASCWPWP